MKSFKELEKIEIALAGGKINISQPVVDAFYASIGDINQILEGSKVFNKAVSLAFYKNFIELFADKNQTVVDLLAKIDAATTESNERISFLNKYSSEIFLKLKMAQLLETTMASYLESINLDFQNTALPNKDLTTALINTEDGLVLGISNQIKKSDKSILSLDKLSVKNVFVTFEDFSGATPGMFEVNRQLVTTDHIVINDKNELGFTIIGDTRNVSKEKTLNLLIDRSEHSNSSFNSIELGLAKPHLVDILVSDDLVEFKSIFSKPIYLKEIFAPCGELSSKYIKIVISKASGLDWDRSGSYYKYKIDFKYINILRSTLEDEAVLVTNGIPLSNTVYTGLSIDTCDNYQDKNVSIKYYIDVGAQERWKEIRPINKLNDNIDISSVFLLNDFYDNKVIQYSLEPTKVGSVFEYQLELDGDFIDSNNIRVFSQQLVPGQEWKEKEGYRTVTGILYTPKVIKIDPEAPIFINGKITNSSEVSLDKGVYKFRVPVSNYLTIYNSKYAELQKEESGLLFLKDKASGSLFTLYDQLYPYNYKRNLEESFDFLFEDELIEKTDYYLYNKDSTYFIRTNKKHSNINLVYRLYVTSLTEDVNSFRVMAKLKSLDKITIPYIERILVKCS